MFIGKAKATGRGLHSTGNCITWCY